MEKILTLHPQGKIGVRIELNKYEIIKAEMIKLLSDNRVISFSGLLEQMNKNLEGNFDGSISWYSVTIKLDLEARGILERIPGKTPQHIRLVARD